MTHKVTKVCPICDHVEEEWMELEGHDAEWEILDAHEDVAKVQAKKRRKLLTHHLSKQVCPNYGFAADDEEEEEEEEKEKEGEEKIRGVVTAS